MIIFEMNMVFVNTGSSGIVIKFIKQLILFGFF